MQQEGSLSRSLEDSLPSSIPVPQHVSELQKSGIRDTDMDT